MIGTWHVLSKKISPDFLGPWPRCDFWQRAGLLTCTIRAALSTAKISCPLPF